MQFSLVAQEWEDLPSTFLDDTHNMGLVLISELKQLEKSPPLYYGAQYRFVFEGYEEAKKILQNYLDTITARDTSVYWVEEDRPFWQQPMSWIDNAVLSKILDKINRVVPFSGFSLNVPKGDIESISGIVYDDLLNNKDWLEGYQEIQINCFTFNTAEKVVQYLNAVFDLALDPPSWESRSFQWLGYLPDSDYYYRKANITCAIPVVSQEEAESRILQIRWD